MILGEIKTSCNLFEISPIDSESQPYVQKFSIFLLVSPIITVEIFQVQGIKELIELSRVYQVQQAIKNDPLDGV